MINSSSSKINSSIKRPLTSSSETSASKRRRLETESVGQSELNSFWPFSEFEKNGWLTKARHHPEDVKKFLGTQIKIDRMAQGVSNLMMLALKKEYHFLEQLFEIMPEEICNLLVQNIDNSIHSYIAQPFLIYLSNHGQTHLVEKLLLRLLNKNHTFYDYSLLLGTQEEPIEEMGDIYLNGNILWCLAKHNCAETIFLIFSRYHGLMNYELLSNSPQNPSHIDCGKNTLWIFAQQKNYQILHLIFSSLKHSDEAIELLESHPTNLNDVNSQVNTLWLLAQDNQFILLNYIVDNFLFLGRSARETPSKHVEKILALFHSKSVNYSNLLFGVNVLWFLAKQNQMSIFHGLHEKFFAFQSYKKSMIALTSSTPGRATHEDSGTNLIWWMAKHNDMFLIEFLEDNYANLLIKYMSSTPTHASHPNHGTTPLWWICQNQNLALTEDLFSVINHIAPTKLNNLMAASPTHEDHVSYGEDIFWSLARQERLDIIKRLAEDNCEAAITFI